MLRHLVDQLPAEIDLFFHTPIVALLAAWRVRVNLLHSLDSDVHVADSLGEVVRAFDAPEQVLCVG